MAEIIEIEDPQINQASVWERIQAQIAQRRASGVIVPDLTVIGPDVLQVRSQFRQIGGIIGENFPGINQALIKLLGDSALREPQFTSSVPLLGMLIVAFRRFWNSISTRWYVLPLIWQQSAFNAQSSMVISEMAQWQEINAQRVSELQMQLAALEARLAVLEEQ